MEELQTIDKAYFLTLVESPKNSIANKAQQKKALTDFVQQNLPTRKTEIWRHTNIRPLLEQNYISKKNKNLKKTVFQNLPLTKDNTLVFINGFFKPDLSNISEKKIVIESLSNAKKNHTQILNQYYTKTKLSERNIFAALESAYSDEGALIFLPKKIQAQKNIHLIFISSQDTESQFIQTHNIFVAQEGSKAQIIISQISEGKNQHFSNNGFEFFVQENAQMEVNWIQNSSESSKILNTITVHQETNSRFTQTGFSLQGFFIRNDIKIELYGENAETNIQGIYIPRLKQHFDNNILIKHIAPHSTSKQKFKGIINDEASAVFLGKVLVAKDAQKTNANQSNRNILLSKRARVNSKPQLEIYADDVICSHGSTTGQLDKEALFYMQTRGISQETAQRLLLYAFVGDIMEQIKIPELKEYINTELHNRFDK